MGQFLFKLFDVIFNLLVFLFFYFDEWDSHCFILEEHLDVPIKEVLLQGSII